MKPCDIIIPIDNDYENIKLCLDSLIKYTNLETVQVFIIDDKSTDARVKPLLEEYKKKYHFIEYYENEQHLGVAETIYKGIGLSKNDIVILDIHSIVTSNWLEKLQNCAYSGKKIATVTPLSNDGRFSSFPRPLEKNEISKNGNIEQVASLIEKNSKKAYLEIPVFDDFCLYIRREAFEEIGGFDYQNYIDLRTQEIDFCIKAINKGYRHILCDDTYIYQKNRIFKNDDWESWKKNEREVLEKNSPKYKEQLDFWYESNPTNDICSHLILKEETNKNRANILYLIHDWVDIKNNLGGTTLHVYDLVTSMRSQYNFHILAPESGVYKLYSYWENNETVAIFPQPIPFGSLNFYNKQYKEMLEKIITSYGIGLVHIQHMRGHYFDIIDVIKEANLYSLMTVHDYYSSCPVANKMYQNVENCEESTNEKCATCLQCVLKQGIDVANWRKEWQELFETVNQIIVPSNSAKQELLKTFPNLEVSIIEHGIDIQKEKGIILEEKPIYNVAFIGAIGVHKGSAILEKLMNDKNLKNIRIHLFGMITGPHHKNTKYFINHGTYKRDELKQKLKENKIDLICLLSTCLETYSYTLTEAIACGIPVLSFQMGALGERIETNHLGWTIPKEYNYHQITEKMHYIFHHREEYNQVIESINAYKIKTVSDMSKDYTKIYEDKVVENKIDLQEIDSYTKSISGNTFIPTYENYAWVFDTLKWKIISKIKIPDGIKRMIKGKR